MQDYPFRLLRRAQRSEANSDTIRFVVAARGLSVTEDLLLGYFYASYFDESGMNGPSEYTCVSGVVSTLDRWLKLEQGWKQILRDHDMEFFHTTDCMAHNPECKAIVKKLAHCLHKYALQGFSAAILKEDYVSANREYRLKENGFTPMVLAGQMAVKQCVKWVGRQRPGQSDQCEYFYEAGNAEFPMLQKRVLETMGISLIERTKKQAVPLQPADLIAWTNRHVTRTIFDRFKVDSGDLLTRKAVLSELGFLKTSFIKPVAVTHGNLLKECERRGYPRRLIAL